MYGLYRCPLPTFGLFLVSCSHTIVLLIFFWFFWGLRACSILFFLKIRLPSQAMYANPSELGSSGGLAVDKGTPLSTVAALLVHIQKQANAHSVSYCNKLKAGAKSGRAIAYKHRRQKHSNAEQQYQDLVRKTRVTLGSIAWICCIYLYLAKPKSVLAQQSFFGLPCVNLYLCICVYVCVCVWMCIRVSLYIYTCVCECVCVCMHVYISIYIYILLLLLLLFLLLLPDEERCSDGCVSNFRKTRCWTTRSTSCM